MDHRGITGLPAIIAMHDPAGSPGAERRSVLVPVKLQIGGRLVIEILDLRQHEREVTLARLRRHLGRTLPDMCGDRRFANQPELLHPPIRGCQHRRVRRSRLELLPRPDRVLNFPAVLLADNRIRIVQLLDRRELGVAQIEIRAQPGHRVLPDQRPAHRGIAARPISEPTGNRGHREDKENR